MIRRITSVALTALLSLTSLGANLIPAEAASLQLGTPEIINTAPDGTDVPAFSGPSMSADGRYVVFDSSNQDAQRFVLNESLPLNPLNNNLPYPQLFLRDRQTGTVDLISRSTSGAIANYGALATSASLSANGRYLVFYANSTNLDPSSPACTPTSTSSCPARVFVRDLAAGTTSAISSTTQYSQSGRYAISGDGTIITYWSSASSGNIVYAYNRVAGSTTQLPYNGTRPAISRDGRYIAYRGDTSTPGHPYLEYLYDLNSGTTSTLSAPLDTYATSPVVSADSSTVYYYAYDASGSHYNLYATTTTNQQTTIVQTDAIPYSYAANYLSYYDSPTCLSTEPTNHWLTYCVFNNDIGRIEAWLEDLTTGEKTLLPTDVIFFKTATLQLSDNATQLLYTNDVNITNVLVAPLVSLAPSAPTGLAATSPTNNAPVLTWNAASGAASYQIWRQDTLTGTNIQVGTSSTTNFTDVYAPGVYNYSVVAVSSTGTTSTASAMVQVAVTNTTTTNARNLMAQGQSQLVPVLGTVQSPRDLLPGLAAGNSAQASFDFDLGYPGGTFTVSRPLTVTFNAGIHHLFLTSTSIDWLVVNGTNNSVGTFQGLASVQLDSTTTAGLPFSVTAIDGAQAGNSTPDSLKLTVFTNTSRTNVLYFVNEPLSKGKIKIN